MDRSQLSKSETISAALKIIDADDTLTLGSRERSIVTETISEWYDEIGPEKTLEQIEKTKAHLIAQIAQMMM